MRSGGELPAFPAFPHQPPKPALGQAQGSGPRVSSSSAGSMWRVGRLGPLSGPCLSLGSLGRQSACTGPESPSGVRCS